MNPAIHLAFAGLRRLPGRAALRIGVVMLAERADRTVELADGALRVKEPA